MCSYAVLLVGWLLSAWAPDDRPATYDEAAVRDTVLVLTRLVDAAANERNATKFIAQFGSAPDFRWVAHDEMWDFATFAAKHRRWAEHRAEWAIRQDSARVLALCKSRDRDLERLRTLTA